MEKAQSNNVSNQKAGRLNKAINQVYHNLHIQIDSRNDGGKGITDPHQLKLRCKGHDVRYRNTWNQK